MGWASMLDRQAAELNPNGIALAAPQFFEETAVSFAEHFGNQAGLVDLNDIDGLADGLMEQVEDYAVRYSRPDVVSEVENFVTHGMFYHLMMGAIRGLELLPPFKNTFEVTCTMTPTPFHSLDQSYFVVEDKFCPRPPLEF
jgi:hypothetical protein